MRMKLEAVLECLLNGEQGEASKMLHEYIVDRSRAIYSEMADCDTDDDAEEVMEVSDEFADDDASMYEVEGDADGHEFGGDQSEEFVDDVQADTDGDDADMDGMGEDGDVMGSVEDRVSEIESSLEELVAEFDRLLNGDEAGDEFGDDDAGEGNPFGDDDNADEGNPFADAGVKEATNFSNKVSVDMSKEGQEAGNGKTQSVDTKNRFSTAKKMTDAVGRPIKTTGGEEKGAGQVSYAKEKVPFANTKTSNVAAPGNTDKPSSTKSVVAESRKPVAKKTK